MQTLTVTHNGPHFERVRAEWQGDFEGYDFAGFEIAGKGSADAVLAEFRGASPATAEFASLKHFDLHAQIDIEPGIAAGVARRFTASWIGRLRFRTGCHCMRLSSALGRAPWPPAAPASSIHRSLLPVQQITRLQRQLAGDLHHSHGTIDGIDVHVYYCPRDRGYPINQFLVGIDHNNSGMPHAPVVGGSDQFLHSALRHLIDFFQEYFGFRRRWGAHDESDGLAVRPMIGLSLADLQQIRESHRGDRIRLVGDEGEISRRSQRYAGQ